MVVPFDVTREVIGLVGFIALTVLVAPGFIGNQIRNWRVDQIVREGKKER
jgi:hypothetical protein